MASAPSTSPVLTVTPLWSTLKVWTVPLGLDVLGPPPARVTLSVSGLIFKRGWQPPRCLARPPAEVVRGSAGMEGTIKFNKRHVPGRWRGRIRLPRGGGGVTARSRRSGDIWLEPRGCVGGEDGRRGCARSFRGRLAHGRSSVSGSRARRGPEGNSRPSVQNASVGSRHVRAQPGPWVTAGLRHRPCSLSGDGQTLAQ